jgi:hypothetical protein
MSITQNAPLISIIFLIRFFQILNHYSIIDIRYSINLSFLRINNAQIETSHGINLRSASAYLFEVTRFIGGKGKNGKKSTSCLIFYECGLFSIFPYPPPLCLSPRRMKTIRLAQRSSLFCESIAYLRSGGLKTERSHFFRARPTIQNTVF